MKQPGEQPNLESLARRIDALKKPSAPAPNHPQGMGHAMQMGVELVAGAAVGIGVGLFLDKWLGTTPVFIILCFFLGCAGGFLTLYRSVQNSIEPGSGAPAPVIEDEEDEDD